MKKVIAGTLITAMVSNNLAYADTIKNEFLEVSDNTEVIESVEELLENNENETQLGTDKTETNFEYELAEKKESVDTAQSVEKTTVKTDIDVFDYNQLKNAVTQSNVNINIKNDISFDNPINITGQNITINGDGRKFDLKQTDDTNRFVIKGNADNIEINNLTFDNYYTTGIYISGKNINLKDITLTGKSVEPSKVGNAKAGIDISDANTTVTLENITSQNHLQNREYNK